MQTEKSASTRVYMYVFHTTHNPIFILFSSFCFPQISTILLNVLKRTLVKYVYCNLDRVVASPI